MVEVFNALGEQIYLLDAGYLQGNKVYVNVAALSGGVYMVRIHASTGLLTRKFVVSR
jgi:hypothetical protein